MREYGRFSQIALMLPSSIAVGLGFGYLLDRWWGTGPWMLLVGTVLGVIAGFVNLYKVYVIWEQQRRSKKSS